MSPYFELKQYFLWCTYLPLKDQPQKSPIFLLEGNEWYFEFILLGDDLCLFLRLHHKYFNPKYAGSIKYEAGFKKEWNLSLKKGVAQVAESLIFSVSLSNEFWPKLTSDYIDGNLIKFRFFFPRESRPHLKMKEDFEEKSTQTVSYVNSDLSSESLSKDLSEFLDTGLDHDVQIKCDQHSIKAHRNILCARSKVFQAMLESDMQEGRTGLIEIKDIDAHYFQDFIRYLYTDAMPELTIDKAKTLYETGDKYAVRSLMLRCSEYLQDYLSSENVFECFVLADAHSDQMLKDKITSFVLDKKLYLETQYWAPFCEHFPKFAIEIYKLSYERCQGSKDNQ